MAAPTSKQFPFPQSLACRPGFAMVKDSFMKNLSVEQGGSRKYTVKRPGQVFQASAPTSGLVGPATGWLPLGMFLIGQLPYWIVGNPVAGTAYIVDINGVTQNYGGTNHLYFIAVGDSYVSWANNYVQVSSSFVSTNGVSLISSYGGGLWSITAPIATSPPTPVNMGIYQVAGHGAPGLPATLRPGIVYIDGTAYVMSASTGQISGSNLQDITTWNPLNIVGTSFNTGVGTGITRHLNYLVAFYMEGIQLFYDAGLAPPGSPLAPLPNGSFQIGCAVPETAVSIGDSLIFVSQTTAANINITMMQGLAFQTISTPIVDNILMENAQYLAGPVGNAQNIPQAFGYIVSKHGHTWYVLRLPTVTLAYDLMAQDWQFWTSVNAGVEGTHNPMFCLNNFALSFETGILANLSQYNNTAYADYNGYINCIMQTPSGDSETVFKKFQTRMNFYGDTIADTMTLTYSNDDYQTWSAPIVIDLSTQRKFVNRLGSFYHRAYNVQYTGNFPFRMEKGEALLELGTA